jgi:hypothetical protein
VVDEANVETHGLALEVPAGPPARECASVRVRVREKCRERGCERAQACVSALDLGGRRDLSVCVREMR